MICLCTAHTPVGDFTAVYQDGEIHRVLFPDEPLPPYAAQRDDSLAFAVQVGEYLAGRRRRFDLPVLVPGTPFRQRVYRAVIAIEYGKTAAYSDVAYAAGHPRAMRAVGSAMKANQLPLLVPCHRVVHKNARFDAYRGGTGIKSFLLDLERRYR